MNRIFLLLFGAVTFVAHAQIESWYLAFNGPSSHTIPQLAEGSYILQVEGTFCGGSCGGGHTFDAAYVLQSQMPWGGRSFTVNEYCPQGWEGAGNCQFLRPTPDEYSSDHIYHYPIFHDGGDLTVYGLADECCWGDNQGGLNFILTPTAFGCTDPTACNYDAEETSDNGSCIPAGCTNEAACNFNPDAGCDDESCAFDEDLLDCDAFGFELDSLVVCFGEEIELTAPIDNGTGAPSGTAQFIDEFYLDFGGPSSHTLGYQPAGSYQITVSGTWCGGSCWNGHTTDAAYSFNPPYGNGIAPYGGNSFTINEYCLQGDNSCELIRPEPDEYNPDHIYTYLFEHAGGELMFYGVADECCWGDNQAGLNFSVSMLPTSPCVLDYAWNNGANEASIIVEPEASDFLTITVSSSAEQCTDSLWVEVVNQGCSDADACNFNPSDLCTMDCIFPVLGAVDCEQGSQICGVGTEWNSEMQTCDPLPCNPISDATACGPGTYWDSTTAQCLPETLENCLGDLNVDGYVGVEDLLQLLVLFGYPCETGVFEYSCGESVSYHGYEYTTVQIGDQCWFKENLRTEYYANGDPIPGNLTQTEWASTTSGAQAIYGEGSSFCNGNCDEVANLEAYGRLYNWYAVDDSRGLCPSGWHVPTDGEWTALTDYLGGSSVAGTAMKSSPGDSPSWNGTNTSGFSALPGGYHDGYNGKFYNEGSIGKCWSASPGGTSSAWRRALFSGSGNVHRYDDDHRFGYSVRCVRDE